MLRSECPLPTPLLVTTLCQVSREGGEELEWVSSSLIRARCGRVAVTGLCRHARHHPAELYSSEWSSWRGCQCLAASGMQSVSVGCGEPVSMGGFGGPVSIGGFGEPVSTGGCGEPLSLVCWVILAVTEKLQVGTGRLGWSPG
jgi:hypothetical protein